MSLQMPLADSQAGNPLQLSGLSIKNWEPENGVFVNIPISPELVSRSIKLGPNAPVSAA